MAPTAYSINGNSWTAITVAGASGTCWVKGIPDNGHIVISHSDAGSGSLTVDDGYHMINNKNGVVPFTADNVLDIFYAKCSDVNKTAEIVVDAP